MKLIWKILFNPIKAILWFVGILLFLVLSLLITIPMWIKPVVCNIANSTVPGVVKTGFTLNDFGLNYFTGKFNIGEMQLDNPEGYEPIEAVKLGDLAAKVDMPSVFTDVIHIENIELRDLFISYVEKGGVNNFDAITRNMGIEADEPEVDHVEEPSKGGFDLGQIKLPNVDLEKLKKLQQVDFGKFKLPKKGKEETKVEEEASEHTKPKKVIIDRIRISGITFHYGKFAIPLPAVTLKDIGKESGGVDWSDAATEIWRGIISTALSAGDMLKALGENALKETKAQLEAARAEAQAQVKAAREAAEAQMKAAREQTEAQLTAAQEEAKAKFDEATVKIGEATENLTQVGTQTLETGSKTLDSTIDLTKGLGEGTLDITKGLGEDAKKLGKEAEKLGKDLFKMLKK